MRRAVKKVLVAVMTAIMYPQLSKDEMGYAAGIEKTIKVALDILWMLDNDPMD